MAQGRAGEKGHQALHPEAEIAQRLHQYNKCRYRRHNRIEIMFGSLKDWRRVATRYDRCLTAFFGNCSHHHHNLLAVISES